MKIELQKFGHILMSRPDGRESFLVMQSSYLSKMSDSSKEKIELDFTGVDVVAPSWLDEVLTPLKKKYGKDRITIIPGGCTTLDLSLEGIEY